MVYLFEKLKAKRAKKLLKGLKGTFLHCNKCDSMFTKFSNVEKSERDGKAIVKYDIECLMCEAKGTVTEEWENK